MDGVISRVADIVGDDLTAAKRGSRRARARSPRTSRAFPQDLKKVGADASKEIGDKFEQLESDVNSKQESVVDTLASKYVEARKGLDERIEELQAENKGLVDKAIGAIKAVINTIRQLAAMLMNVLARVAGVVGDIISDPVALPRQPGRRRQGRHHQVQGQHPRSPRKGLMGWLFGALAEGGIELPDKFDLKGIIKLSLAVRPDVAPTSATGIVKQIGEKAMAAVEKGVGHLPDARRPAASAGCGRC